MAVQHDLIVIGAGPGGYVAAIRAAQLGLNVACIEKEPALGGTCLRVGCIPSKALLESSERYHETKHGLEDFGVRVQGVELDLARMLKKKDSVVSALTGGVAYLFKKHHVTRYAGHGRIVGPGRVVVEGEKPEELSAQHILIATGSKPAALRGVQFDGDRIGASTEGLSFPEVPGHLVVIGAGYIGLELGSVWNRLGSKVTVVEYLDRILPGMDSEIAEEAERIFEKQGLEIRLDTGVTAARVEGGKVVVELGSKDPIVCDRLLVAVGRVPLTGSLSTKPSAPTSRASTPSATSCVARCWPTKPRKRAWLASSTS
jgi:dihydrolipoamide dehydrogenase